MQQPQYYKTVRASERLPDKEDTYYVKYTTGELEVLYASGVHHEKRWKALVDEWLEPIPLPDAERLRDKMQEIADMKRPLGIGWELVAKKMATIAREALSQTGDGWVRVEEKQPQFGEMVWVYDPDVIFPNQYMATWNPCKDDSLPGYFSVGALQGQECWYVTHWRPLPSPPQNK